MNKIVGRKPIYETDEQRRQARNAQRRKSYRKTRGYELTPEDYKKIGMFWHEVLGKLKRYGIDFQSVISMVLDDRTEREVELKNKLLQAQQLNDQIEAEYRDLYGGQK